MTRKFQGTLRPLGPIPHPGLIANPRPMIRLEVMHSRERYATRFMIDTGADFTLVQPRDVRALLGPDIDRTTVPNHEIISLAGIGSNTVETVARTVGLRFYDTQGLPFRFSQTILFALPPSPGRPTPWNVPSLLGRDILRYFDLHLSYDPPTVSLSLS